MSQGTTDSIKYQKMSLQIAVPRGYEERVNVLTARPFYITGNECFDVVTLKEASK